MYASYNFMLVMSILAMSLEHRFCISRKGRWVTALLLLGEHRFCISRKGRWVTALLLLGLAVESPWSAMGGPFLFFSQS